MWVWQVIFPGGGGGAQTICMDYLLSESYQPSGKLVKSLLLCNNIVYKSLVFVCLFVFFYISWHLTTPCCKYYHPLFRGEIPIPMTECRYLNEWKAKVNVQSCLLLTLIHLAIYCKKCARAAVMGETTKQLLPHETLLLNEQLLALNLDVASTDLCNVAYRVTEDNTLYYSSHYRRVRARKLHCKI